MRYLIFLMVALAVVLSKISRKNHRDYFLYTRYDSCDQECSNNGGASYMTRYTWEGLKYNCCLLKDRVNRGSFYNGNLTPGKCKSEPLDVGACYG